MAKGFTLIEVLVSLIILSVGLLSLAKFHTSVMRSNILAKERTKAVVYAREGIENYRQFVFSGINRGLDSHSGYFTRTQEIAILSQEKVEVKMLVTWPDLNESDGAVTDKTRIQLSSVVSQPRIYRADVALMLSPTVSLSCLLGHAVDADGNC